MAVDPEMPLLVSGLDPSDDDPKLQTPARNDPLRDAHESPRTRIAPSSSAARQDFRLETARITVSANIKAEEVVFISVRSFDFQVCTHVGTGRL